MLNFPIVVMSFVLTMLSIWFGRRIGAREEQLRQLRRHSVLLVLREKEARALDVANACELSPYVAHGLLRELEEDRLVVSRWAEHPEPTPKRAEVKMYCLTPKGQAIAKALLS